MATIAKVPRKKGVVWKVVLKRRGKVLKTKTFKSKTAARAWARRIEADAEWAEALADPGRRITFNELAELYLANWSGRDHHRRTQVCWWREWLGATRLADVSVDAIQAYLTEYASGSDRARPAPRAPASVNRMKAAFHVDSSCLSRCEIRAFTLLRRFYTLMDAPPKSEPKTGMTIQSPVPVDRTSAYQPRYISSAMQRDTRKAPNTDDMYPEDSYKQS